MENRVPQTIGELRQRLAHLPDDAEIGKAGLRPLGLYFSFEGDAREQERIHEKLQAIVARVHRRRAGEPQ